MELLQQILPLESLAHPAAIASLLPFVVLFLYWYGTRGFADLKKLNVPGPRPVPFLGNFLEARKYNGMHLMHLDYLKKYGKVYAICLGGKPSLVVADPEFLKQIMMKDFPNFRNRFIVVRRSGPFGKNVFNARDETWKRIRSTLTPTFSPGQMKLMVPLIEKSCDTLVEKLEKIADSGEWRNACCSRVAACDVLKRPLSQWSQKTPQSRCWLQPTLVAFMDFMWRFTWRAQTFYL